MSSEKISKKAGSSCYSFFKKRSFTTESLLLCLTIILFIFFSVTSPSFMTFDNIGNLLKQTSINGIVAIGMLFVIISAGIDISVGATVGLSGIVVALLLRSGMQIPSSIIVSILMCTLVGIVNGVLIYDGKVPSFIATLGMMTIVRGVIMLGNL